MANQLHRLDSSCAACNRLQRSPMSPARPSISRPKRASRTAVYNRGFGTVVASGGGVLDRPTIDIGKGWRQGGDSTNNVEVLTRIFNLDTGSGDGNEDRLRGAPPGGGNYRILLIDSPKHTEAKVVKAITTVISGTDPDHARNCFSTSRELGMAIITSCLKEHAEFYSEQLNRSGVRSTIEPDSTTA